MSLFRRRLIWLGRAWPLLVALALPVVHVGGILWALGWDRASVNPTVALVTHIAGVALVIWSIDSTLAKLKNTSLPAEIRVQCCQYLRKWPKKVESAAFFGRGSATSEFHPPTGMGCGTPSGGAVEERLDRLESQIRSVHRQVVEMEHSHKNEIETIRDELTSFVGELHSSMAKVEEKVEGVAIGGLKGQLFGLYLLVYGAFTSWTG